MLSVIASFFGAMIIAASLTPLVRRLALRLRAVDEPSARRVHERLIPRLGGLALVGGFFIPLLALFLANPGISQMLFRRPSLIVGMTAGALLMAALGAADDIVGVRAKHKLTVQVAAAVMAYYCGFQLHAVYIPGFGVLQLGWLSLPATVLWISAVINALNLIDGLDGLAAGVAFFACVANFTVAMLNDDVITCFYAATLGGALIGFLLYNFNPATIFMGDSGSMFLGFLLAIMSLFGAGSYKGSTAIALVVPLLALGLPIMDMLLTMVRRLLAHRSIFSPDRGHIHHRLLDAGFTHRRAVLTLYGLCITFTAGALAIHVGRSWQIGVSLTILAGSVVAVARFSGYFSRALSRAGVGAVLPEDANHLRQILPEFLFAMRDIADWESLVSLLEDFAKRGQFVTLHFEGAPASMAPRVRWESPSSTAKGIREAVTVVFEPKNSAGPGALLFSWDCAEGEVNPQCRVLLQLFLDQLEVVMQRIEPRVLSRREEGTTNSLSTLEQDRLQLAQARSSTV